MLDQNLFINDYEETKRRLIRKKVSVDQIEEIRNAILDIKALYSHWGSLLSGQPKPFFELNVV
jgi:hypothetical protein